METGYYSDKTVNDFIKKKLCQGDELLYKYYREVDVAKFRSRLSKFRDIDREIKDVVQTLITDYCRDIIIKIIEILTLYMKPFGDLIISGGSAFNAYFDTEKRIITTDIDTKFTPIFRIGNKLINSRDVHFFGFLQVAKLFMWNKLGQIVTKFNYIICKRIQENIIKSDIGKLLGISFAKGVHALNRRYTLIKKSIEEKVLIDIELFAIDLQIRYYVPSLKKVFLNNIGGVLDIAYMRPYEFGYEATYTKSRGLPVVNMDTGKLTYNKNVLVASKKFLIDDIYYLQKYKLRPGKIDKDRKRLYMFSKYVLKVQNIKPTDSLETIFKKSEHVQSTRTNLLSRPKFTAKYIRRAIRMLPLRYANVTTKPDIEKVSKQLLYGIKGPENLKISGYHPTRSKFKFLPNSGTWVKNNAPEYIHNEADYRPNKLPNTHRRINILDSLYGYNPVRDGWIPKRLLVKAAAIPLVGLKLKNNAFVNTNV
jgi:hypothetical protein